MYIKKLSQVAIFVLLSISFIVFPECTSANTKPYAVQSYVIADPIGDWGYPSPYLRYARGPGYIRSSFIFDTLIWRDKSNFVPALAKEWSYNEADNAYTFKLQENAVWHDGTPFTAEDVVFTVEYLKKHPDPFVTLVGPSGISRAEVVDKHMVKLYLDSKYAPFLYEVAGTMVILPKHIWKAVDNPMSFDSSEAVIGTGPYMLVDYNKAQGTYLFKAFDNYYQGKPIADQIAFVKVSNEMVTSALIQGKLNAASILPEMVGNMKTNGFTVISCPYGWCAKLNINHKKEPLNDKRFRQAMAYAINRQLMVEITQRGHAIPGSQGLLPPNNRWYNPNIEQYNYNPDKARQLLGELGYELNNDGYLSKDNKILELNLITQTAYGFKDVGQFIKDNFEDVGIKTNLIVLEGKSLDAKVEVWDFDISIYGHGGLYEPSILPKVITSKGFNSARYTSNDKLNQVLEAQLHEMNQDTRLWMVQEAQALYSEDIPAITLYYPDWCWAHDGKIDIYYPDEGVASGIPIPLNKSAFVGK